MVMQTNNPDELNLLALIKGNIQTESMLHAEFKSSNIRGEWYSPTKELLDYIDNLPCSLAENFNKAKNEPCACGNRSMHMKLESGLFVGYCRSCLMIKDGRMKKLLERVSNRKTKDPEPCKVCGKEEIYLRRKRCAACSAYFKRTGVDRPEELIHRVKQCTNCNSSQKNLSRGLCGKCYYYQSRYNEPRPLT